LGYLDYVSLCYSVRVASIDVRVLVCGSRHFHDQERINRELSSIRNISEIIHGGAAGTDTCAGTFGRNNNIPVQRFRALWELYGRRAGPIRNRQMLREGKPDLVIAFLAPNSRGTKDMITAAKEANIPIQVINIP